MVNGALGPNALLPRGGGSGGVLRKRAASASSGSPASPRKEQDHKAPQTGDGRLARSKDYPVARCDTAGGQRRQPVLR